MLVARSSWASDHKWRPELDPIDTEGDGLLTYRIYQHTLQRAGGSDAKLELDFTPASSEALAIAHVRVRSTARQVEVYVHDPESGVNAEVGDTDAFTYLQTKRGEPFADVEPGFRAEVAARAEKLEVGGKFFLSLIHI